VQAFQELVLPKSNRSAESSSAQNSRRDGRQTVKRGLHLELARHEHDDTLDQLVERELAARPEWTREALGERPDRGHDSERWDRAAEKLARYRITYVISVSRDALGPQPPASEQRHDYERAQQTREELAHSLQRETRGHRLDLGR
jgi:hypothetical protein